jgi:hypothetical protein
MNSGKMSLKTPDMYVRETTIMILLVFILLCVCSCVSANKQRPGPDSLVTLDSTSEDVEDFCRIFVDCTGLRIPDSVASLGRRYIQSVKPRDLRYTDADVFAYVYFDNELVVEEVRVGTFLPQESDTRDTLKTRFLQMFSHFLVPSIVGRVINPSALSFPGGRPGSAVCLDGFGDVDTSVVDGLSRWMPRSGCLIMHFKFVRKVGGITLDRRAVVSFRYGL